MGWLLINTVIFFPPQLNYVILKFKIYSDLYWKSKFLEVIHVSVSFDIHNLKSVYNTAITKSKFWYLQSNFISYWHTTFTIFHSYDSLPFALRLRIEPQVAHEITMIKLPFTLLSFSSASWTTYSDWRFSPVWMYWLDFGSHLQLFGRQSGIAILLLVCEALLSF